MRVEIIVMSGPAKGQRFTFDKPARLICGRTTDAHISFPNDQHASRHHFLIEISLSECKIRDLNSRNGVVVNRVRYGGWNLPKRHIKQAPVNETSLKNGDKIVVGRTRLKVSIQRDPPPDTLTYFSGRQTISKHVALFVFDIVGSTQYLLNTGDTYFTGLMSRLYKRVTTHTSSSELFSLKCTGDGFLAVFHTIPAAFSLASTFLEISVYQDSHVRMALHWGAVKASPEGHILGKEIQRVHQIEGVQREDQIAPATREDRLPMADRILITRQGFERLHESDHAKFRPAGTFRLQGFFGSCELWILHKEIPDHEQD